MVRPLPTFTLFASLTVAVFAACGSQSLGSGSEPCNPLAESPCPTGYECVLVDPSTGEYRCEPVSTAICGNGVCEPPESPASCAADCGPSACGDGSCGPDESVTSCPADCYCGNLTCDDGEDMFSCFGDCHGPECGDGVCDPGEAPTCPADCPVCGNGFCDPGETPTTCPADCGPVCGDGVCDPGETPATCPSDCGSTCTHPVCDLVPQCGCPVGLKCSLSAFQRACLPAGATPEGGPCLNDTECAVGTWCFEREPSAGQCLAFCDPSAPASCAGASSYCQEIVDDNDNPVPDTGSCTTTCEPHAPAPECPNGWGCAVLLGGGGNQYFTDCVAGVGSGTAGDPCDPGNGLYCAGGYGCFDDGAGYHCYQWCVAGSGCVTGTCELAVFSPPIVLAGVNYGVCL